MCFDNFYSTIQADLMGKEFSYTVDLSGVGCHCNANGYFVGMPAPSAGDLGDFYCDANFVGGNWSDNLKTK